MTIIIELQLTNIKLGLCGFTHRKLDSNQTYCISYGFPVAVSAWASTKYFPSVKIQMRGIHTVFHHHNVHKWATIET